MSRILAWFGGLTTGVKALVVALALLLFAVLSPLIAVLAVLFLVVCVPVVAYRMLMRRPFRRPGLILLVSLAVLLLAGGVSGALYGTSTEQARSPADQPTKPRQEKPRLEAAGAAPETTAEAVDPPPREKAAEKPEPRPDPKPEAEPKPEPEPEPKPRADPKPKPSPVGPMTGSLSSGASYNYAVSLRGAPVKDRGGGRSCS